MNSHRFRIACHNQLLSHSFLLILSVIKLCLNLNHFGFHELCIGFVGIQQLLNVHPKLFILSIQQGLCVGLGSNFL